MRRGGGGRRHPPHRQRRRDRAALLYPLVNEAAKLLDEGIALRAGDVDVVWMHGYGFPRYRGGPLFWADMVGVANHLRHAEPAA